jgi:hypothetical protein
MGCLGRDGNIDDLNNAPNDIEQRREDDAYKKKNKWIVEYSLKCWNTFRWLNVTGLVIHESISPVNRYKNTGRSLCFSWPGEY